MIVLIIVGIIFVLVVIASLFWLVHTLRNQSPGTLNSRCSLSDHCVQNLVCSDNLCKVAEGRTCTEDSQCVSGSVCSGICVKVPPGDRGKINFPCNPNNTCLVGNSCVRTGEELICKGNTGTSCNSDVDCVSGICSEDHVCSEPLSLGEPCTNSYNCASNNCSPVISNTLASTITGYCQPPNISNGQPGAVCNLEENNYEPKCNPNIECVNNVCITASTGVALGGSCGQTSDCSHPFECVLNRCQLVDNCYEGSNLSSLVCAGIGAGIFQYDFFTGRQRLVALPENVTEVVAMKWSNNLYLASSDEIWYLNEPSTSTWTSFITNLSDETIVDFSISNQRMALLTTNGTQDFLYLVTSANSMQFFPGTNGALPFRATSVAYYGFGEQEANLTVSGFSGCSGNGVWVRIKNNQISAPFCSIKNICQIGIYGATTGTPNYMLRLCSESACGGCVLLNNYNTSNFDETIVTGNSIYSESLALSPNNVRTITISSENMVFVNYSDLTRSHDNMVNYNAGLLGTKITQSMDDLWVWHSRSS